MAERTFQPTPRAAVAARGALVFGLALMSMGQTVLFAILGPVARELGLTEIMAGAIISLAAVIVVLSSPWWGRRVDRWGRRTVFLLAMIGLAVSTLIFTLILEAGLAGLWIGGTAFAALAVARMIYGFLVTGTQPAAIAWIADTTTPEARTGGMAIIGAAFGLGAVLGPALAWVMSGFALLAPLYLISGLAVLAAALAWFAIPETMPDAPEQPPRLALTDRRVRGVLLVALVAFVAVASIQQTVAFYVQDIAGLDAAATAARVGQAMALLALAMFLTQVLIAVRGADPQLLIGAGASVGLAGCMMLALWPTQTGILMAHALSGFGFGAVIPGLQGKASLAVGPEEQGAAGGLVAAGMAAGYVIGPVFGTSLYTLMPTLPYLVAAGLMAGVVAVSVLWPVTPDASAGSTGAL